MAKPDPLAEAKAADLDAKIIELKRAGRTFREIAADLDLSSSHVHRCFQRGIQRAPVAAAQAYRDEQLARLAASREVVLDVLHAKHLVVSNGHIVGRKIGEREDEDTGETVPVWEDLVDDGPVLAAVAQLQKLDDQEARLLGLYPATKLQADVQVNYTVGGGVDPASLT